ncbi:hypothetical protein Ae707Ps1_1845c [Pseudonocardia sp. Ae707_Ps1]|nr:hypothetical protein Ae707Ps1_1845c [Pseudonocardia sp. Ae707_Ps1]
MSGGKRKTKRRTRNGVPQTAEHRAFLKRARAEDAAFRKRLRGGK